MSVTIKIKEKEFFSFKEFGENIYLYPEESYKLINSKKFLLSLKKEDETLYEKVVDLRKNESIEEVFLFKVQYIFNPLMGLRFYRNKYASLKALGNKILSSAPKVDVYVNDLIKHKLISHYFKIMGFDKIEPLFYQKILALEETFSYNEIRTYFKFGFVLSSSDKIVYRRKKYGDIESFFKVILSPAVISDFASDFEKTQYVFAWLEILGYEKEIIKFESVISSVEEWEE